MAATYLEVAGPDGKAAERAIEVFGQSAVAVLAGPGCVTVGEINSWLRLGLEALARGSQCGKPALEIKAGAALASVCLSLAELRRKELEALKNPNNDNHGESEQMRRLRERAQAILEGRNPDAPRSQEMHS